MEITKVLIPAAGIGNRFLPYTKAVPQEMLPLLNYPAIHYAVDEATSCAISNIICVTNKEKSAIAHYFDENNDLDALLKEKNQENLLVDVQKIMRAAEFTYIRQSEPLGLGHAIWLARNTIYKEYFGLILPDDLIFDKQPAFSQLLRIAKQEKATVIAVQEIPIEQSSSYGMIAIKKQLSPSLFQVSQIIDKPNPIHSPSHLAVIGRYILSHKIFTSLEEINRYGDNKELSLNDAINNMIQNNEKVFAYKIQGTRYDLSSPLGWLKANIGLALQHPHYSPHIRRFIAEFDLIPHFFTDQLTTKNNKHLL